MPDPVSIARKISSQPAGKRIVSAPGIT